MWDNLSKRFESIKNRLPIILKSRYSAAAAAALGLVGMLLIPFSGGQSDEPVQETTQENPWSDYKCALESQPEDILSAIDGVGEVRVMITLDSSEEYVYARSSSKNNDKEDEEYVIVKNGSQEEALVESIKTPSVTGVVVVCEGGGSSKVCEKVYMAVRAALNISAGSIYVTEMD